MQQKERMKRMTTRMRRCAREGNDEEDDDEDDGEQALFLFKVSLGGVLSRNTPSTCVYICIYIHTHIYTVTHIFKVYNVVLFHALGPQMLNTNK